LKLKNIRGLALSVAEYDVVWYGRRPVKCWGRMSEKELEEARRKRKLNPLTRCSE